MLQVQNVYINGNEMKLQDTKYKIIIKKKFNLRFS
jgi:hypothetical protein